MASIGRPIIVYMTVPSRRIGQHIAKTLVKEKLAACANILGPTDSVYQWKGTIEETKEFMVLLKSTNVHFEKIRRKIVELHPYECPCILQIDIKDIHKPYLDWLRNSVG